MNQYHSLSSIAAADHRRRLECEATVRRVIVERAAPVSPTTCGAVPFSP